MRWDEKDLRDERDVSPAGNGLRTFIFPFRVDRRRLLLAFACEFVREIRMFCHVA